MKYRPEIDGLRALAVISVVLSHFFPNIIVNGYLGVDIFFVISGYLITIHLISMNGHGIYDTLKSFYDRRIKRIFPALFVFLSLTSVAAFFVLLSPDLDKYFSSLLASKTFWANWYFWRDGGYFGDQDRLKPLLHLWSLSVEEQFYIFYPIFVLSGLWVTKKIGLNLLYPIGFATIMSFLLWLYLHYIDGSNPAYFLLPTRSWQFGIGAIVAILHNNLEKKFLLSSNLSLVIILCLLLLGLTWFSNQMINTIIVTFAASLFIYFKPKNENLLLGIFKTTIVTFIGKISYSLYLYHWPIAVFLYYFYVKTPPFWASFYGLILSLILGYFSFRLIEKPFRYSFKLKHTVSIVLASTIVSLCIFWASFYKDNNNYVNEWAKTAGTSFRCSPDSYILYGASRACVMNPSGLKQAKVLLLGNSHAQMYTPLVSKSLIKFGFKGLVVPLNGCLPTVIINISKSCIEKAKKNLKTIINDQEVKIVFIATTWYRSDYLDYKGQSIKRRYLLSGMENLIDQLKVSGKDVVLFSPIPIPVKNLTGRLPRLINFGWMSDSDAASQVWAPRKRVALPSSLQYDEIFGVFNSYFDKKLGARYIKVYDDLCDNQKCYYTKDNMMLYSDGNHISSLALGKLLKTQSQVETFFLKVINK